MRAAPRARAELLQCPVVIPTFPAPPGTAKVFILDEPNCLAECWALAQPWECQGKDFPKAVLGPALGLG